MTLAATLRQIRKREGLSQAELAERSGVSARTIGDIETGVERRLRTSTLELLLDALRVESAQRQSILAEYRGIPQILHQQAAQFPRNPYELVGRARDVDGVVTLIREKKAHLVTLVGPAGVGKTSTAIAAALRMERHFSGNIVFVGLLGVDDPERVEATILEHLGLGADSPLLTVPTPIVLVVVDNFEHLMPSAARFGALLSRLTFARFLVTSREPLRLRAEHIVPIEPLKSAAAADLFRACARRVDPDVNFAADEAPLIVRICAKLDDLPLAIELAAPRLRFVSLAALEVEVDAPLAALAGGARDTHARHRSMEAAIAASYGLLDSDERDVFVTLGLFRTGATTRALAACLAWAAARTTVAVESLAQKSLIRITVQAGVDPWISLLAIVREFAKARARECSATATRRHRYVGYYRTLTSKLNDELFSAAYITVRHLMRRERDNAHEAVSYAIQMNRPELGLRIVLAAVNFLVEETGVREPIMMVETLLPLLRGDAAHTEKLRARSYRALAFCRCYVGELDVADRAITEAIALARRYEPHDIALYYDNQLIVSAERGDYEAAKRAGSALLNLRRKSGDLVRLAVSLSNVAIVHMHAGELEAAGRILDEMHAVLARVGECHNLDGMLETAAHYHLRLGDLERAERLARRALAMAPSHRGSVILRIEQTLGDIACAAQMFGNAFEHFARALDHAAGGWDYPSRYAVCAIVVRVATALHKVGRTTEADRADALASELEAFWSLRLHAVDRPVCGANRSGMNRGGTLMFAVRTKAELADAVRNLHSLVREAAQAPPATLPGCESSDPQNPHFRQFRALS